MAQGGIGVAERGAGALRRMMVDGQIRTFDVTDQRVLDVFYRTPREDALPDQLKPLAYSDAQLVLPCGGGRPGRPLLQPMFLAKLLQGGTLEPGNRVLVVAGASGYTAALVAPLTAAVVSLDSEEELSTMAKSYLAGLGLGAKVTTVTGALEAGYAAGAPFDRIIVNGGVEAGLEPLFAQLAPGGCLLTIRMDKADVARSAGKAMRFDRIGADISERTLFDAAAPVLPAFRRPAAFVF